jgi:hypothetical protein
MKILRWAGLAGPLFLSACGGGYDAIEASSTQVAVVAPTTTVSAGLPLPDCAPEGCKGLRVIDGNAEAYRADAASRAAREAKYAEGAPQGS